MMTESLNRNCISRRTMLRGMLAGAASLSALDRRLEAADANLAAIDPKDHIKITKVETFPVNRTRSVFLKVHTDAGIVGLGEPSLEGWSPTVAKAVEEMSEYLIGKDPRQPVHHWQAIYRHGFYRGGPVLTSALSGIDMALWDIKGKALGVPVYELLGGPTRDRIRVYAHVHKPDHIRKAKADGFTAFKTMPSQMRPARIIENVRFIQQAEEHFAGLRDVAGPDMDIAVDFHGAIPPQSAKLLIKALEPYQPLFIEEPVQYQNLDVMADIARGTHLPIATGERIMTKWGFREVLEKQAASILQPDICHVGGITEMRIVAGMAEAYYAGLAPHGAEGIISTAAAMHVMASIPNLLILEQKTLGEGYVKQPFKVERGYVRIPTGPGLGIELDEEAIAKLDDPDWNFPERYDEDDGSVTDW